MKFWSCSIYGDYKIQKQASTARPNEKSTPLLVDAFFCHNVILLDAVTPGELQWVYQQDSLKFDTLRSNVSSGWVHLQ